MYGQVFQPGILSYKRWFGGGNVGNLVNNALRFADPDFETTLTIAEIGYFTQNNDDYVARMNGFFIPAVTTNYVFYVSADNDGFLFLSTDSDYANRKLIAADVGWQNTREWTGPGGDTAKRRGDGTGLGPFENRSDELLTSMRAINGTGLPFAGGPLSPADGQDPEPWPTTNVSGNAVITLTAGQRYAFQMWHQEFDNGRFEATFKFEGEADPTNATTVSRLTGGLIGAYVDPTSLLPVITGQPTNVNFTVGGSFTLAVTATSSLPITYQWSKNGAVLTGATNSSLVINNASVDDIGSYSVAVANENGAVNSAIVTALTPVTAPGLTFQEDSTGTTVIEAEHYYSTRTATDGHLWVPTKGRAGNSGPGYVSVLPDSGVNAGNANYQNLARLDFRINFVTNGIHYLWLRGGDPRAAGDGDSVHAGIDDVVAAPGTQITGAPTFTTLAWNWVGANSTGGRVTLDVTNTGIHTVSMWMREDGFLLDKLVLTMDSAFTPTGTGPAESALVGGGSNPTISIGRNAAGQVVITYSGTLLSSPTVNGTYSPVSGASSPYTVPTGPGSTFCFAQVSQGPEAIPVLVLLAASGSRRKRTKSGQCGGNKHTATDVWPRSIVDFGVCQSCRYPRCLEFGRAGSRKRISMVGVERSALNQKRIHSPYAWAERDCVDESHYRRERFKTLQHGKRRWRGSRRLQWRRPLRSLFLQSRRTERAVPQFRKWKICECNRPRTRVPWPIIHRRYIRRCQRRWFAGLTRQFVFRNQLLLSES
jgi:hypothetical protein